MCAVKCVSCSKVCVWVQLCILFIHTCKPITGQVAKWDTSRQLSRIVVNHSWSATTKLWMWTQLPEGWVPVSGGCCFKKDLAENGSIFVGKKRFKERVEHCGMTPWASESLARQSQDQEIIVLISQCRAAIRKNSLLGRLALPLFLCTFQLPTKFMATTSVCLFASLHPLACPLLCAPH